MFGGYCGQIGDKQKIQDLKLKLENDPDNLELKNELVEAKKHHRDRMDSALRSYSRL